MSGIAPELAQTSPAIQDAWSMASSGAKDSNPAVSVAVNESPQPTVSIFGPNSNAGISMDVLTMPVRR